MDVEYKIVSYGEFKDTEEEVNALLKERWDLLGDLKVISGTPNIYVQAMVKREDYGGFDHHTLITIDELDGIKYAIESIGEALNNITTALGYMAKGLSDRADE
jgi:hypothetical protein